MLAPLLIEAISGTYGPYWEEAIKNELQSMMKTGTLIQKELSEGRRPISSKFGLKRKWVVDGKIKRYKARIVAHGYLQILGVDFDETNAPAVDW